MPFDGRKRESMQHASYAACGAFFIRLENFQAFRRGAFEARG
jgi:hypothetical protein